MKSANIIPTHSEKEHSSSEEPRIKVIILGKAKWNFFAFRGVLLAGCRKATQLKLWEQSRFDRFSTAIEHCHTHDALKFVAEGFGIELVFIGNLEPSDSSVLDNEKE